MTNVSYNFSEAENSFYITKQFKWNIIEFYFLDENKL